MAYQQVALHHSAGGLVISDCFLSISVSSDWVLQYWAMGKYIQMSSSTHGEDPVPVGKSVNIRAILMYTSKFPT